jgi:hypothetical protein
MHYFTPTTDSTNVKELGLQLDYDFDEWFAVEKDRGLLRNVMPRTIKDEQPTHLEYGKELVFNSSLLNFSGKQSDPFFRCLFPDLDAEDGVVDLTRNHIFATRSLFRKLINTFITRYLPPSMDRYLTEPKDFVVYVERVNSLLVLQSTDFKDCDRGYNGGFESVLTCRPEGDLRSDEDDQYANFYRMRNYKLGECQLMLKHEVDAVDKNRHVVSIKTKSAPKNPRYEALNRDFFINLWTQNFFGDVDSTRIAVHRDGVVRRLESFTTSEIQLKAEIDQTMKRNLLQLIEDFLHWVLRVAPDNKQGIISYRVNSDVFCFESEEDYSLPVLSSEVRTCLSSLTF